MTYCRMIEEGKNKHDKEYKKKMKIGQKKETDKYKPCTFSQLCYSLPMKHYIICLFNHFTSSWIYQQLNYTLVILLSLYHFKITEKIKIVTLLTIMHDRKTIQGCKVKKEQCTENININNQEHNILHGKQKRKITPSMVIK